MTALPADRKESALWLLEQVVPGSAVNHLSLAFEVDGRIRPDVLQESMTLLVRRHEALRTVFHATGTALTRTVLPSAEVVVESATGSDQEAEELLAAFVARPFGLDGRLLVRALRLSGPQRDHVCIAVHHLVFDTISGAVLLTELVEVYNDLATGGLPRAGLLETRPALPEPQPTEASLGFWRDHLRGFDPNGLGMWVGEPEVADPSLRGDQVLHHLSEQARETTRRLQKELRAPEAVILLAAYYLLLARHGAGPDIIVGSPVSTRGTRYQGAIGYHVNVLPLRCAVDPANGFDALVKQVRSVFMGTIARLDVAIDRLLEDIPRTGSSWHNPLFRYVFNYVPGEGLPPFEIDGMAARPVLVENGYSKFDLEFFVLSSPDSIGVRAAYCVEAFDRGDVEALLRRYEQLLLAVGADPTAAVGGLDLFSAPDREAVASANDTVCPVRPTTVLEGVLERTAATPERTAVEDDLGQTSYRALLAAARDTARSLRTTGVGPGDVVALLGQRGPDLAAAALGTWLAGAAYLPLDPGHPQDRLRYQLTDSGARVVLADDPALVPNGAAAAVLPLAAPVTPAGEAVAAAPGDELPEPDSCAYLIYTSGSTGRPKGTRISHRSLANLVTHFAGQLAVTSEDALLWLTTFSFDISALELFLPLLSGGRVVVAPDHARTDGHVLADTILQHRVGIVQATPTTWRMVVQDAAPALSGCRVLCGGEPMPEELARRLGQAAGEVWNVYGPTETTIWSAAGRIEPDGHATVTVGRPIANTTAFVIDPDGHELPVGVTGELCLAGAGVALGYHDRPELTADRFRHDDRYGRHYRTGDLARWLPDGRLQVIGRTDRQVKLRGNRIELAEVESVLLAHEDVRTVAVVVAGDPNEDGVLVAFVDGPDKPDMVDQLWEQARARLPRAAVPSEFVFVDVLPTTGNDKIDYPALTRLAEERRTAGTAAGTDFGSDDELLTLLVSLWRELLGRDDVDDRANFFASGGHSLLGAQLVQRIEMETGRRVRLADVFEYPTPHRLAEHLRLADSPTTDAAPSGA
ncbi:amino acid adenylation domain-containing protein [Kitasatospora sp. NPDC051705]|uniref:amino acid adenylation domain-containing protein n=1 Tax=Kitasatospora sp. NPDC051705 TaxID=3364057 RepID=UPI0037BDBD47